MYFRQLWICICSVVAVEHWKTIMECLKLLQCDIFAFPKCKDCCCIMMMCVWPSNSSVQNTFRTERLTGRKWQIGTKTMWKVKWIYQEEFSHLTYRDVCTNIMTPVSSMSLLILSLLHIYVHMYLHTYQYFKFYIFQYFPTSSMISRYITMCAIYILTLMSVETLVTFSALTQIPLLHCGDLTTCDLNLQGLTNFLVLAQNFVNVLPLKG